MCIYMHLCKSIPFLLMYIHEGILFVTRFGHTFKDVVRVHVDRSTVRRVTVTARMLYSTTASPDKRKAITDIVDPT